MNMMSDLNKLVNSKEKRTNMREKYCKLLHSRCIVSLIIVLFMSIVVISIGWFLHVLYPPAVSQNATIVHSHVELPVHLENRRNEFKNNTFITLLQQHQLAINTSNCWVCGLLPHTVAKGMPFITLPFSYEGSCTGWWETNKASYMANTDTKEQSQLRYHLYILCWRGEKNRACGTPLEQEAYADHGNRSNKLYYQYMDRRKRSVSPVFVASTKAPFCVQSKGKIRMGDSICNHTVNLNGTNNTRLIAAQGTYFICGDKGYTWLPQGWSGTCYIAFLLPPTYTAPADYHEIEPLTVYNRRRRGVIDTEDTAGQEAGDFFAGVIPFWGPMVNSRNIRHLTRVVQNTIDATAGALSNLTAEVVADRLMTLQNRIVLDIVLADRGGVCRLISTSCCVFIPNNAPTVYQAIAKLHKMSSQLDMDKGEWSLSSWLWGLVSTWGWKVLTVVGSILFIIFSCCLCIQCGPAICGLCATACIPRPHVQSRKNEKIMLQEHINGLMKIEVY